MLKTSNTDSAEPRKGIVEADDGSRNKAELVDKHGGDNGDNSGHDDGGSRSSNFDKKFHPILQYNSRTTHLDAQNKLINKTYQLARPRL